jgi:hypothetical protein
MKRVIRFLLIAGPSALVLASLLVHPFGSVKAVKSTSPLLEGAELDATTLAIFERSCRNCHSEKTEWPWYSYVAPMSLMVESDVSNARSQMNLSHWDEYTAEKQHELVGRIGAVIKSREMPPSRYTLIHKRATLSADDRSQLYQWTLAERRRLRSVPPIIESGQ